MSMIALSKAPLITITKISRENVRFEADREAIERSYGRALHIKAVSYQNDALASVTVSTAGREICVDVSGCGCEYSLKWQELEDAKQVYTCDERYYNRTRF